MLAWDQRTPEKTAEIKAGALTGLAGGIVMSFLMMVSHAAISGSWSFRPVLVTGFLAAFPLETAGGAALMLGILLHLAFATMLGMIWAYGFGRQKAVPMAALGGVVYSVILFTFLVLLLAPLLDSEAAIRAQQSPLIFGYLGYGLTFGVYSYLLNRFLRRLPAERFRQS